MYSTITAHTRSFQAFFCTRATSFLPLTTGRNVGLTATMQQRPSALYHILSNPVNSTPTRRFSFLRAFSPVNPKTGTPLGVPVFRILLSILRPAVSYHRISRSDIVLAAMMTSQQTSGAAHSALPSPCGASLGHALISSFAAAKPNAPPRVFSSRSSAEVTPPARTTARTAAGTARAETDDTTLSHPTATFVV